MKKLLLILFMLVNVILIAGSSFALYVHVTGVLRSNAVFSVRVPAVPVAATQQTTQLATAVSTSTVKAIGTPLNVPLPPGSETLTRKYLFTYHNARAHQVAIRADFTGWKAEPMVKNPNGKWTYTAQLSPGEYAYCFTADDKTFKDPANKRTKLIGRTLVSAIVVEALSKTSK